MGNQLTVANATASDIYAYGSVIEFDIQKISADVGLKNDPAANFTFGDEEVKLGWIAIAPSKKWTFPKLAFSRYFLTVVRKDSKELISSGLQIPWRTNIIVTPDYKLAVAKSGKFWVDESDNADYSPKKRNKQSTKSNG